MSPKDNLNCLSGIATVIVALYWLLMQWEDVRHTQFFEPQQVEDSLVKKLQGSVHVTKFEDKHVLCVWFSIDDFYGQILFSCIQLLEIF